MRSTTARSSPPGRPSRGRRAGLQLLGVRPRGREVARPLPRVPGLGHVLPRSARRRGDAPAATAGTGDHTRPIRIDQVVGRPVQPAGRAASANSTGCSAADSSPASSSCWPVSPASASRRCCCRPRDPGPPTGAGPRADRQRRGVGGAGPAARRPDGRAAPGDLPGRRVDLSGRARRRSTRSAPAADRGLGADHRRGRDRRHRRRCQPGEGGGRGAHRGRQGTEHRLRAGRPRHQGRRRSPAPGCWSTSSTWCCTSRATATPRCGWSAG